MTDYIAPHPCKKCGQYRHKADFSVGREWCAKCEAERYEHLYVPTMDERVRQWEMEAMHAKMESLRDGTAIIVGD